MFSGIFLENDFTTKNKKKLPALLTNLERTLLIFQWF